jgi:ATP-dependent Lhr-like helicase
MADFGKRLKIVPGINTGADSMITKSLFSFDDGEIYGMLEPEVRDWFRKKFKSFTPAQRHAVMSIHSRKSVLVSSPTGSGKTLSAFLAILNELIRLKKTDKLEDKVYVIYVSPLRALNNDIRKNLMVPLEGIERKTEELGIRVGIRTSDTTASEKAKMLRKPPHILITTPESLSIVLNAPKFRTLLDHVNWLIVDEIHSLAGNKRGAHLSLSIERLCASMQKEPVRIGLSATIHPLEEVARYLVGTERDCIVVDVNAIKETVIEVKSPIDDFIYTPAETANAAMYKLIDEEIEGHNTTLIFTNTRSATERVVFHLKSLFGKKYVDNIEAHHSSISRETRLETEDKLKQGLLKAVVSSTSLELGIDIGSIDLVILLGSPKSSTRLVQRIGRSGHRLSDTSVGHIIVLDRDDMMESVVLAQNARDGKFESISVIKNPLDVLVQHVLGMALERVWGIDEAYAAIRRCYNYSTLEKSDFINVIRYLSGEFSELEAKYVYGKIWMDNGQFGKRGKLARAIYIMNTGTIPDESSAPVFMPNEKFIGKLEEGFIERLVPGDIFVLGGNTYEFVNARGSKVFVNPAVGKKPTIPAWFSEMLPLPYESAKDLEIFRHEAVALTEKELAEKYSLDDITLKAVRNYVLEQKKYGVVPTPDEILVEEYIEDGGLKSYIFHTVAGRKATDALGRAFAGWFSERLKANVRVTINDNGFMITVGRWKHIGEDHIRGALSMSRESFVSHLKEAVSKSELLRRRFKNVSVRGLLVLKRYPGKIISLKKQQFNSDALYRLINLYYPDFPLLKEGYREAMEDAIHQEEAIKCLEDIGKRRLVFLRNREVPTPFGFSIAALGASDIVIVEDKKEFIKALHEKLVGKKRKNSPRAASIVVGYVPAHSDDISQQD